MTSAASVSPKAARRRRLLDYLPEERPISIQLSGSDPSLVATAAAYVARLLGVGVEQAARDALTLPWSNGPVEGDIHRIKLQKRRRMFDRRAAAQFQRGGPPVMSRAAR